MAILPQSEVMPDEPLDWLFEKLQLVVWAEEPRDQVAANILLFIIALLASFVTLGATLVLAAIFFFFGSVGVARLAAQAASVGEQAAITVAVAVAAMLGGIALGGATVGVIVGLLVGVAIYLILEWV